MRYDRRGDDAKFRVVKLDDDKVGSFQDFHGNFQDYPEGCVIEIQKTDGTTFVEYGHARQKIVVSSYGIKEFHIPAQVPTGRLWVHATDAPGMYYKVPLKVKIQDQRKYIMIPGGVQNAVLVGDEYFNAAYELG